MYSCMAPCAMDSSAMEGAVHSHRDFRVRKSVVHRALNWLVTHNQYYRSNHVHIDVNALEQLPHDGKLSQLTSITVESASTEPPATITPATGPPVADTPETSEDPYSAHLPVFRFHCHSIYDRAGGSASVCSGATIKPIHVIIACHHDVASIGGVPINEFTTEGYFSCAFPTLFPTGTGDFSGQRQNQVTNYFKHLMMNDANVLPNTHVSASSPSTLRCDGVHFRPAEYTSSNTQVMPSCH